MFLTTFDKKMYAEALREEGREEMQEKYEQVSKELEELSKDHEILEENHEKLTKDHEMLTNVLGQLIKKKGITYEEVKELAIQLNEETLQDIYGKK